jgi:CelD/BcsL family acetyltransferase involved in cellulose biosynthesis
VARVLRGARAIAALSSGWRRLQDEVRASPMVRIEWAESYLHTYGAADPDALWVFAVEQDGRLDAVAPMILHRGLGERRLESMGVAELFEPTDVLYRDAASARRLLRALLGQRLPLVLERLPLDSSTADALLAVAHRRVVVVRRPRAASPTVSLEGADPEHLLNAGHRSDLRRFHRHAEKHGAVTTELLCPKQDELPALLDAAFRVEASSWKGKQGDALLQQPKMRAFFEHFAGLTCASGVLRMAFLKVDDRPIAMQLSVECSGALWLLKIGYDEAFSDCSPGSLLMYEVIRDACAKGLHTVEFLGNAAPWTRMWTKSEYASERVVALPVGTASLTFGLRMLADKTKRTLAGPTKSTDPSSG